MAKTPHRTIRVPDDHWYPAVERAEDEGTNLSVLIRDWVTNYAATGLPIKPHQSK